MKVNVRKSLNWSIIIAVITFVLAAIFAIISSVLLGGVTWAVGMLVVLCIVLTGVIFDVIGVASTAAAERPFHSMAANRVHGARHAILLTRNADRVSNFCNDVVGDVSGIVSGVAAAAVVIELAKDIATGDSSFVESSISVIFTSVIAALTVGGKAFGKSFAIKYATDIIFQVGRLLYLAETRFRISLFRKQKRQSPKAADRKKKNKVSDMK